MSVLFGFFTPIFILFSFLYFFNFDLVNHFTNHNLLLNEFYLISNINIQTIISIIIYLIILLFSFLYFVNGGSVKKVLIKRYYYIIFIIILTYLLLSIYRFSLFYELMPFALFFISFYISNITSKPKNANIIFTIILLNILLSIFLNFK